MIADHMLALAKHLYDGGEITGQWIQVHLSVSRATASRYMLRIECGLPVLAEDVCTNGGVKRRTLHLMPQSRRTP